MNSTSIESLFTIPPRYVRPWMPAQEEMMNYGLAQKADVTELSAVKDAHTRALSTLRTETLNSRATVADVAEVGARVDAKAGRQEVDRALERKVDAGALEAMLAGLVTKAELSTATARSDKAHSASLSKASDATRVELSAAMDRLRADVGGAGAARDKLDRREVEDMRDTLGREVVALKEFGVTLKAEVMECAGRGRGDGDRWAASHRQMQEQIARLREGLAAQSTTFTQRLDTVEAEELGGGSRGVGGGARRGVEDLWEEMTRKADKGDVAECRSLLDAKADTTQVRPPVLVDPRV